MISGGSSLYGSLDETLLQLFPGSSLPSSQTRIRAPTLTRLVDPQSHTVTWYHWCDVQMSDRKPIVQMSPLQCFFCAGALCRPRQDVTLGGCPCRRYVNPLLHMTLRLSWVIKASQLSSLCAHPYMQQPQVDPTTPSPIQMSSKSQNIYIIRKDNWLCKLHLSIKQGQINWVARVYEESYCSPIGAYRPLKKA